MHVNAPIVLSFIFDLADPEFTYFGRVRDMGSATGL